MNSHAKLSSSTQSSQNLCPVLNKMAAWRLLSLYWVPGWQESTCSPHSFLGVSKCLLQVSQVRIIAFRGGDYFQQARTNFSRKSNKKKVSCIILALWDFICLNAQLIAAFNTECMSEQASRVWGDREECAKCSQLTTDQKITFLYWYKFWVASFFNHAFKRQ